MSLMTALRQTDIFVDLKGSQLELISSISSERHYSRGATIFEENSTGDELYIIIEGSVEIVVTTAVIGRAASGEPQVLARLHRGQSFGEIALVDQGVRSAGARAGASGAVLAAVPRERLMKLCDMYPELGYRLMRNLAADLAMKIRSTDLQVRALLTRGSAAE